jgi:hypothetical protein
MDIMSSSRSADIRYGLVTSMSVDGNAGALVVKRS